MNDKILKLEECKLISREMIGKDQVDKNLKRAFQDIVVARANVEIDREASYNYSYLAMLRAGRALMFFYGYRPFGTNQHKTVVSFAEIILGKDSTNLIFKFDKMRKFRNKFTYEEPGILISENDLKSSIDSAEKFIEKINSFIKEKSSQEKLIK
ncbi:MAG TPA: HEPN domain-containing protein [Candidatus Pacearchaeota archaeon]|nr:HEPN domain-containing protein [Candidatus Pacearchaeota archaeon]